MTKKLFLIFAVAMALSSCKDEHASLPDGLYAEITTNKGVITCALEYSKTPVTVANFVTLAEGKNDFVDPRFRGRPFYNGLKFHRVIPNFMIQGGDPLGNGSGDAGYKFKDEFTDLAHDKPGILSMANSGPNTNSSQFFITHVETPWLDGKHTIFGHVVENGMETVNKIVQDDAILSVDIIRKGEAAKKFDAVKVFSTYFASEVENQKKQAAAAAERKEAYIAKYKSVIDAQVAYFDKLKKEVTKLPSGLSYIVVKKGNGKRPAPGTTINLNYAGFLEDGTLFDTSLADAAKKFGTFDAMRAAQNGYAPLPFLYGRKDGLIPGFIEGLDLMAYGDKVVFFIPANLAYGEAGAGEGVIPPNANLIFELELLNPTK